MREKHYAKVKRKYEGNTSVRKEQKLGKNIARSQKVFILGKR